MIMINMILLLLENTYHLKYISYIKTIKVKVNKVNKMKVTSPFLFQVGFQVNYHKNLQIYKLI